MRHTERARQEADTTTLALARDLARQERQILLLEQEVQQLESEIGQADRRAANLRADHAALIEQLQRHVEALRRERDDLILTTRMLREKLSDLHEYGSGRGGGQTTSPRLPHVPRSIKSLKVAAIMDEFTFNSLDSSCTLFPIDPARWERQLDEFKPDLLFVESAWNGNEGKWTKKVNHPSRELLSVLDWCHRNGVATVFWNKEDPVHFDTFINTAKRFDHVFTTDLDCIGRYKSLLGHDRVYLLPFWGQPRLHNPVERYPRKQAFCFAGAYYVRYPERQRDFDTFIDTLEQLAPVEVFDRNHGKDDPNYNFPQRYARLIQGTLPYADIDRAYKGYEYGINLNSVKQSQSMFARRAFDLMLSNTHVVSNYSRGIRLMFGDLMTSTDDGAQLSHRLRPFFESGSQVSWRRMHRLLALRKVMLEHTAENRLAYVLGKASGRAVQRELPSVVVVARPCSDESLARALSAYDRQAWARKRFVLVLADGFVPEQPTLLHGRRDVSLLRQHDAAGIMPAQAWAQDVVAFFSDQDFHGANYLTDMALAFLYSTADVVGKGAWYQASPQGAVLQDDGRQYHWCESLPLRRCLLGASALAGSSLEDWLRGLEQRNVRGMSVLAVDEFGYVADAGSDRFPELDEPAIDAGLPIQALLDHGERIPAAMHTTRVEHGLDANVLASLFEEVDRGNIRLKHVDGAIALRSLLADTQHAYVYATRLLEPGELAASDTVDFNLVAMPGVRLDVVLIFQDADGNRLGQAIKPFGRNHSHAIPDGTASIRLGLRVLGPGSTTISGLSTQPMPAIGALVPQLGRARHLVLTNIYPSATHLYRNGFVHRRVLGYRAAGTRTDVFALAPRTRPHAYEFEGIDALVGSGDELRSLLDNNAYESVLVHFLDPAMWEALQPRLPNTRVYVWAHGAEVQPWHRRDFNFDTDAERERAKQDSELRMAFWREVLANQHPNLHFVFVSQRFADGVMEDTGVDLPRRHYSIIHNFIDTDLFAYVAKDASQRFKVLSIRPFASKTYANDLSVQAILALREQPWFGDMQFRIIGDGPLFEQTLEPLRGLDNVHVERGFLRQEAIAALHREYGIFLCPTRMDSQGVSRDEAMASGLVPVTNAVAAVPEFVDDSCGVLAPGEDWSALAEGMARLVENPELFLKLSESAARRVRAQSAFAQTIAAELELFSPHVSP